MSLQVVLKLSFPAVIKEAIPCAPACSARSMAVMFIQIFTAQKVTALASFLRSFICSMHCGSFPKPEVAIGISRLLALCSPAAVFWRVRAVVVDAVYGMSRAWFRTHIHSEGFKGFSPSIANNDSFPAPISKVSSLWIRAALNHVSPSPIKALIHA